MNTKSAVFSFALALSLFGFSALKAQTPVADHWSPYAYPRTIPEGVQVHLVVKGDTLWSIAQTYFQDPYVWPLLYQANAYIGDPNLIYPGDPIILSVGSIVPANPRPEGQGETALLDGGAITEDGSLLGEAQSVDEAVTQFEEGEAADDALVSDRTQTTGFLGDGTELVIVPAGDKTDIECSSYIYSTSLKRSELPFDLKIVGGESRIQESYSDNEVVYLNQGTNAGLEAGMVFSIRRVKQEIYQPDQRKISKFFLGYAVDQIGRLDVVAVQEGGSTALISHACESVLKGDFLVPYEPEPIPLITEQPPFNRFDQLNKDQAGTLLFLEDDIHSAGIGHLVNCSLGISDNVAPGDIFVIFRPNPHLSKETPNLPEIYLGQAVVLKALEQTALLKITIAVSEIHTGDFVTPFVSAF